MLPAILIPIAWLAAVLLVIALCTTAARSAALESRSRRKVLGSVDSAAALVSAEAPSPASVQGGRGNLGARPSRAIPMFLIDEERGAVRRIRLTTDGAAVHVHEAHSACMPTRGGAARAASGAGTHRRLRTRERASRSSGAVGAQSRRRHR